ncbi:putative cystathionine beta-lyase [Helianthus anomalus]
MVLMYYHLHYVSLMAKLDRADHALCFSSGMAALSAVTHLVNPGKVKRLLPEKTYMAVQTDYCHKSFQREELWRVDTTNLDMVASTIGPETKLVWLESPTNPQQQISDIRIAHDNGALLMVDNSLMSSVLCQPLELGADFVMNATTKFVAGHSDVMAGVLSVRGETFEHCMI